MKNLLKSICVWIILLIISITYIHGEPKVTVKELISGWTLRNQNGTVEVSGLKLPSGVYSALKQRYGAILHSRNHEKLRWIAHDNWTYIAEFDVLDYTFTKRINLTLHGIDTISIIRLNGKVLGHTANMFARYSFDINESVREQNILEIQIISPIWASKHIAKSISDNYPPNCPTENINGFCHRNMIRKMQSSFGSEATLAALSMGIWKYVTLEFYDTAIMRDVDLAVTKTETHWTMDIRVFLSTVLKKDFYGNLTLLAPDLLDQPIVFETRTVTYTSLTLDYRVEIPKEKVIEWWPNGYGEQKLYPIVFVMKCFEDIKTKFHSGWITQKVLNFGFRTIQLIEDEDHLGRTFYFKVNGKPIFIKGAIYLPSHILPEEESHLSTNSQDRLKHIMLSAKDANFNMIRIWGGGVYGSDLLYSYADIFGLLIWQDLPFTRSTYPVEPPSIQGIRKEVAQNAKRIGYHPSLALIVTNDEIELYMYENYTDFANDSDRLEKQYAQLFMGVIRYELNVIARDEYNPQAGPILTTPSLGFRMNQILPESPQNPGFGDVHFWPALEDDVLDSDIWPTARFISEYGFQSLPIRSSWNRTCSKDDTIMDLLQHRQQSGDGFDPIKQVIENHFHSTNPDVDDLIYLSQIAQALAVKTATEVFLTNKANYLTMGAIFWHLNDVWIAPTWSSIDFYGNYKVLYYWSKKFLAPITIIPLRDKSNNALKITIINEALMASEDSFTREAVKSKSFNVTINIYLWSELYHKKSITIEKYMGDEDIKDFPFSLGNLLVDGLNENNCFFEILLSKKDHIYASNIFFPGKIKDAIGIKDPQLTITDLQGSIVETYSSSLYFFSYTITICVTNPALFVYIEIDHPEIVQYELSNNGFLLMEPIIVIHLSFEHDSRKLDSELTTSHIKVTTMNKYMLRGGVSSTVVTTSGPQTVSNGASTTGSGVKKSK